MEETRGWRKLRWPSKVRGAGKQGGYRVIFSYKSESDEVWILTVLTKITDDDLSRHDRKVIQKKV